MNESSEQYFCVNTSHKSSAVVGSASGHFMLPHQNTKQNAHERKGTDHRHHHQAEDEGEGEEEETPMCLVLNYGTRIELHTLSPVGATIQNGDKDEDEDDDDEHVVNVPAYKDVALRQPSSSSSSPHSSHQQQQHQQPQQHDLHNIDKKSKILVDGEVLRSDDDRLGAAGAEAAKLYKKLFVPTKAASSGNAASSSASSSSSWNKLRKVGEYKMYGNIVHVATVDLSSLLQTTAGKESKEQGQPQSTSPRIGKHGLLVVYYGLSFMLLGFEETTHQEDHNDHNNHHHSSNHRYQPVCLCQRNGVLKVPFHKDTSQPPTVSTHPTKPLALVHMCQSSLKFIEFKLRPASSSSSSLLSPLVANVTTAVLDDWNVVHIVLGTLSLGTQLQRKRGELAGGGDPTRSRGGGAHAPVVVKSGTTTTTKSTKAPETSPTSTTPTSLLDDVAVYALYSDDKSCMHVSHYLLRHSMNGRHINPVKIGDLQQNVEHSATLLHPLYSDSLEQAELDGTMSPNVTTSSHIAVKKTRQQQNNNTKRFTGGGVLVVGETLATFLRAGAAQCTAKLPPFATNFSPMSVTSINEASVAATFANGTVVLLDVVMSAKRHRGGGGGAAGASSAKHVDPTTTATTSGAAGATTTETPVIAHISTLGIGAALLGQAAKTTFAVLAPFRAGGSGGANAATAATSSSSSSSLSSSSGTGTRCEPGCVLPSYYRSTSSNNAVAEKSSNNPTTTTTATAAAANAAAATDNAAYLVTTPTATAASHIGGGYLVVGSSYGDTTLVDCITGCVNTLVPHAGPFVDLCTVGQDAVVEGQLMPKSSTTAAAATASSETTFLPPSAASEAAAKTAENAEKNSSSSSAVGFQQRFVALSAGGLRGGSVVIARSAVPVIEDASLDDLPGVSGLFSVAQRRVLVLSFDSSTITLGFQASAAASDDDNNNNTSSSGNTLELSQLDVPLNSETERTILCRDVTTSAPINSKKVQHHHHHALFSAVQVTTQSVGICTLFAPDPSSAGGRGKKKKGSQLQSSSWMGEKTVKWSLNDVENYVPEMEITGADVATMPCCGSGGGSCTVVAVSFHASIAVVAFNNSADSASSSSSCVVAAKAKLEHEISAICVSPDAGFVLAALWQEFDIHCIPLLFNNDKERPKEKEGGGSAPFGLCLGATSRVISTSTLTRSITLIPSQVPTTPSGVVSKQKRTDEPASAPSSSSSLSSSSWLFAAGTADGRLLYAHLQQEQDNATTTTTLSAQQTAAAAAAAPAASVTAASGLHTVSLGTQAVSLTRFNFRSSRSSSSVALKSKKKSQGATTTTTTKHTQEKDIEAAMIVCSGDSPALVSLKESGSRHLFPRVQVKALNVAAMQHCCQFTTLQPSGIGSGKETEEEGENDDDERNEAGGYHSSVGGGGGGSGKHSTAMAYVTTSGTLHLCCAYGATTSLHMGLFPKRNLFVTRIVHCPQLNAFVAAVRCCFGAVSAAVLPQFHDNNSSSNNSNKNRGDATTTTEVEQLSDCPPDDRDVLVLFNQETLDYMPWSAAPTTTATSSSSSSSPPSSPALRFYQPLNDAEQCQTLLCTQLGSGGSGSQSISTIVVGTAVFCPEEPEPTASRIVVYHASPSKSRASPMCDKDVRGCIYCSCAAERNRVLFGINASVEVYRWCTVENGLLSEYSLRLNLLTVSIAWNGNNRYACSDLNFSVSIIEYDPVDSSLHVLKQHPEQLQCMDSVFLGRRSGVLTATEDLRLVALSTRGSAAGDDQQQPQSSAPPTATQATTSSPNNTQQQRGGGSDRRSVNEGTGSPSASSPMADAAAASAAKPTSGSERGGTLRSTGQFFVGERITGLRYGTLSSIGATASASASSAATSSSSPTVMTTTEQQQLSDIVDRTLPTVLFATVSGSLGSVIPITRRCFLFFHCLESAVKQHVRFCGNSKMVSRFRATGNAESVSCVYPKGSFDANGVFCCNDDADDVESDEATTTGRGGVGFYSDDNLVESDFGGAMMNFAADHNSNNVQKTHFLDGDLLEHFLELSVAEQDAIVATLNKLRNEQAVMLGELSLDEAQTAIAAAAAAEKETTEEGQETAEEQNEAEGGNSSPTERKEATKAKQQRQKQKQKKEQEGGREHGTWEISGWNAQTVAGVIEDLIRVH